MPSRLVQDHDKDLVSYQIKVHAGAREHLHRAIYTPQKKPQYSGYPNTLRVTMQPCSDMPKVMGRLAMNIHYKDNQNFEVRICEDLL